MEKRRIAILGSTGSIGKQTLDVVREHRDLFDVELLVCRSNWELMAEQAREFDVNAVVISDKSHYRSLQDALEDSDTKVFAGMDSACDLVAGDNIDVVVASIAGFSGLEPTLSAIRAGKVIALANKETLVAAGAIVMDLAERMGAPILPVDSEHSAIFQCLLSAQGNKIEKIHLTASGGPFRTWEKSRIETATKAMALKHPNWDMGAKITIDSATMMNKGFEVIEARWLFDMPVERINVVVHPESIIHSMIEFEDGAVIAQMANPDMREPIQLALGFPERLPLANEKLDFAKLGSISFFSPDLDKFPALGLAFKAMERGGNIPCVMDAANEAAVAAYLRDRIPFYGISDVIGECMERFSFIEKPTLEDIFSTNEEAYSMAESLISSIERRS
ncbi:MAG: 1-deoxy-D-xylulose-5-phosphate reductoisomerase [Bacteroidales bacterium]|nr:1-deoxy-D-xylulose-5-phosphate reductoisomerase [Candidatus Cryptobacteroides faecihippi]